MGWSTGLSVCLLSLAQIELVFLETVTASGAKPHGFFFLKRIQIVNRETEQKKNKMKI